MRQALGDLDRILRGDATHLDALGAGSMPTPARRLSGVIMLLAMFYGMCMGCFALVSGQRGGWLQMLSSMAKVPALFFLTLAVTLPSLYVFKALVGSRLTAASLLRLLVAAMGVMLALLASFGTIIAFFSFTTTSYSFMVLMNVAVFAISGTMGLVFLLRTLQRLSIARVGPVAIPVRAIPEPTATTEPDAPIDNPAFDPSLAVPLTPAKPIVPGALSPLDGRLMTSEVKTVFRLWVVLFGLVGAQMSWILRPFIGGGNEFALFRERGSNFFQSITHHISNLF